MRGQTKPKQPMTRHPATYTFDPSHNLYYFRVDGAQPPPYLNQRHVSAILDLDGDGNLAGVELIDNMPPPSVAGERVRLFHWRTGYVPRHRRR